MAYRYNGNYSQDARNFDIQHADFLSPGASDEGYFVKWCDNCQCDTEHEGGYYAEEAECVQCVDRELGVY